MPVIFGSFETSLRGQDSPRGDKRVLHKGCSGHLHGHGVKKERASRQVNISKDFCEKPHEEGSSSDEGDHKRRSQSSEYARIAPVVNQKRSTSTNSAVAQRLFNSPTKAATAKYRAERTCSDGLKMASDMKALMNGGRSCNSLPRRSKLRGNKSEEDSGNFSSSEENTDFHNVVDLITPSVNKQNLIHGTSDDELSIEELRRKQRQERRDYLMQRRESPSPVKREGQQRGRRSSDEASDSSYSPPNSPMIFRSSSNKCRSMNLNAKKLQQPRARSSNSCAYAFGSSTKRFADDKNLKFRTSPLNKSGSDGVQKFVAENREFLSRTLSDPKSYGRQNSREKQEIAKAWLKFKEDIEAAMQKKPNSGYYKNLADMMTTKMESLNDQVGLKLLFSVNKFFCI